MPHKDPEKKKASEKAWRVANKERVEARNKAYYKINKEEIQAQGKIYYAANREKEHARAKAWYSANKEKAHTRQKAWRKANKDKINASNKAWSKANKAKINARARARQLLAKYGITQDTWSEWHEKQNGCCPITGVKFGKGNTRSVVHHNHRTGHTEGLWSSIANLIEGQLLKTVDPIKTLKRLLKYFEESVLFHRNGNDGVIRLLHKERTK